MRIQSEVIATLGDTGQIVLPGYLPARSKTSSTISELSLKS